MAQLYGSRARYLDVTTKFGDMSYYDSLHHLLVVVVDKVPYIQLESEVRLPVSSLQFVTSSLDHTVCCR